VSDYLDPVWHDERTPEQKLDDAIHELRQMFPEPKSDARFQGVPIDEFERDDLLRLFRLWMKRMEAMRKAESDRLDRQVERIQQLGQRRLSRE